VRTAALAPTITVVIVGLVLKGMLKCQAGKIVIEADDCAGKPCADK
jgi:hypothetical protein